MKNILVVKANNRPDGVSAKMFDTFVENLDTNNVDVVTFDVYAQPMPYIGQTLFEAFGKLSQEQELNQETVIENAIATASLILTANVAIVNMNTYLE